jgi:Putative GTPases (G3E family)
MKNEIELYLVSGFLGSGKTTFLQRMLNNLEGVKVGVIINEFGGIGIDGAVIEKDGISLVEINNGSIFCSCMKGSFIKALIEFSAKDIDVLLIENSGMADPSNIHQIIGEVGEKANRQFHYNGAICILDSVSFLKHVKVLAPVQNQVASSNFIIINKIDRVNQSYLEEIEEKVREINPEAFICRTMYSDVPEDLLKSHLSDNGYIGETSNKCYNRPTSYSIEGEGIYTEQQMEAFIHRINPFILRMKGFLKGNNTWWKVDVVEDEIVIMETALGKRDVIDRTKLVVIGHDTRTFQDEIEMAWTEIFHDIPFIYE